VPVPVPAEVHAYTSNTVVTDIDVVGWIGSLFQSINPFDPYGKGDF
jgi:hypothetical protein